MIITKVFTKKMYFFISCTAMILNLYLSASEQRSSKRKRDVFSQNPVDEQETKYREKVRAAWKACRIPDLPNRSTVDESRFRDTIKQEGEKLLPLVLVNMILDYSAANHPQRWNLTQLERLLNVSFDYPFGLVSCSDDRLAIAAQLTNSAYKIFNISLTGDDVTVSKGILKPTGTYPHVRCGTAILTLQTGPTQLVSLKRGKSLFTFDNRYNNLSCQVYARNRKGWLAVRFASYQIYIIAPLAPPQRQIKQIDLKMEFSKEPQKVVLCQPTDQQTPWILVFSNTGAGENQLDIFESTQGNHLASVKNPGKFLHTSKDHQSIECINNSKTASQNTSVISRYALPLGTCINQTKLDVYVTTNPADRTSNVFTAYQLQNRTWKSVLWGVHPRHQTTLIVEKEQLSDCTIQEDIADKRGDYIAAIVRDNSSQKQQLVVWNIE